MKHFTKFTIQKCNIFQNSQFQTKDFKKIHDVKLAYFSKLKIHNTKIRNLKIEKQNSKINFWTKN